MEDNIKFEFRYLELTDDLSEVGRLIYHADPYIYPAFFGNEENASVLLKEAIKKGLYCFQKENIFGVFIEHRPIAVLCKKQIGKYKWNYNQWKNLFSEFKVVIPDSFEHVAKNHFMPMNQDQLQEEIYIFSVCVSSEFRNKGIGHKMMEHFFSLFEEEKFMLDVLESNLAAISLYKDFDFRITGNYIGYNIIDPRPRCVHMYKSSK